MEEIREHAIKFNEGIRVQEVRSCLLCNSEGTMLYANLRDSIFNAPGTWEFLHCSDCRLAWLNPRPILADIKKLYDTYPTHNIVRPVPKFAGLRKAIRNAAQASLLGYNSSGNNRLQRGLMKILSFVGPVRENVELGVMTLNGQKRGKLLDVGCGNGQLLAKMRGLGWDVVGVEPDGQAVNVGRKEFRLEIYEGTLHEAGFPDDRFDAITMSHVIEHASDPIDLLKECRRVLKRQGRLVVVTPNLDSLAHMVFQESCRNLELPRHFFLFSHRSLKACSERAGLSIVGLRTTTRTSALIWRASKSIQKYGKLPGGCSENMSWAEHLRGLMFHLREQIAALRRKTVGEELVLIATK